VQSRKKQLYDYVIKNKIAACTESNGKDEEAAARPVSVYVRLDTQRRGTMK
jgi:hypothetical protein